LANLKKIAESFASQKTAETGTTKTGEEDEVPDLVDNFEEAAKEAPKQ
jgi:hypothetical protein